MADEIDELWSKLSLSKIECSEIDVGVAIIPKPANVLVGRFVMKRSIGAQELGFALKRIWNLNSYLKVNSVNEGVFVFEFGNNVDCNRLLAKHRWNFNGALLIFCLLEGDERPADLKLVKVPFWIQIHGLQLRHMTTQVGRVIGSRLGEVLEVESSTGGVAWGRCLRVKVLLDVTRPLCRGSTISTGSIKTKVLFRYEKLSDFCYFCGILDHVDKDCPTLFESLDLETMGRRQYGP